MDLSTNNFKSLLEALTSVYEGIEKIVSARLSFLGNDGGDVSKANEGLLNLVAESKDLTSKYREGDGQGSISIGAMSKDDARKAFELAGSLQASYGEATELFESSEKGADMPKNKKTTVAINGTEQEFSVGALEQGINKSFKEITKQTGAKGNQTSINVALESVFGGTQSGGNLNVDHNDDRRPWAVAKEVQAGSEKEVIQAALDKYNEENGTNFGFKQKNGFLQIYDGNKAINPEQEDELNGIIAGIDPVGIDGSSGDPIFDRAVETSKGIVKDDTSTPGSSEAGLTDEQRQIMRDATSGRDTSTPGSSEAGLTDEQRQIMRDATSGRSAPHPADDTGIEPINLFKTPSTKGISFMGDPSGSVPGMADVPGVANESNSVSDNPDGTRERIEGSGINGVTFNKPSSEPPRAVSNAASDDASTGSQTVVGSVEPQKYSGSAREFVDIPPALPAPSSSPSSKKSREIRSRDSSHHGGPY